MTNKIDAIWFNEVGIVRVTNPNDQFAVYYIGPCKQGNTEDQDKAHIASWGSKFSTACGDFLFGDFRYFVYGDFKFYVNDKSAKFLSDLIQEKESKQVRKSAQIELPAKVPPQGSIDFLKALDAIRKG